MFSTEHQSNRLVNLIGIILILMAIVIAYLGKVVNVGLVAFIHNRSKCFDVGQRRRRRNLGLR